MWRYIFSYSKPEAVFTTQQACEKAFSEDRDGVSETALAQATTAASKLAELIGMLHEQGVLSDAAVAKLLGGTFERVA